MTDRQAGDRRTGEHTWSSDDPPQVLERISLLQQLHCFSLTSLLLLADGQLTSSASSVLFFLLLPEGGAATPPPPPLFPLLSPTPVSSPC